MTLEAWVFPTANRAWRDVIYKGDDNYFLSATSSSNPAARSAAAPSATPHRGLRHRRAAANTWTHLAATYDGTTSACTSTAPGRELPRRGTSPPRQPASDRRRHHLRPYFAGRIDEVRVYNRHAPQPRSRSDMQTPVAAGLSP